MQDMLIIKINFTKKCNKEFAAEWIKEIEVARLWIKGLLK
jgi:hypothetical protein